jgi:hypothetical protein
MFSTSISMSLSTLIAGSSGVFSFYVASYYIMSL